MKYQITWSERKTTSTGKEKINATLKEGDKLIENVTIWSDYPDFANLMTGYEVEGSLIAARDPKWGPTLYPVKDKPMRPASNITKAMEKKEESISKFQGNKELSIKVASTFSMATNVVITMLKDQPIMDTGVIRSMIEDWRNWFWVNWDKEEKDFPPFQ